MLHEIIGAAMPRQALRETIMRVVGATVLKQGGCIEIPFGGMDAVIGSLTLEVDGDKKVVILRVRSEEEMAKERAMAESESQEKH